MKIILIAFACCFIYACAERGIKVACVGDSLTEGADLKGSQTYPRLLQQLLGNRYKVKNYGRGSTTLLKNGNFPYWSAVQYKKVLASKPDIVIIMFGTNDSKPQNWKYKDDFKKNYTEFIHSFKNLSSDPVIHICCPIPVFEDTEGITASVVSDEIIPLIKEVTLETNSRLIDLHTPFLNKGYLSSDGIHLNKSGNALLAKYVYETIRGQ